MYINSQVCSSVSLKPKCKITAGRSFLKYSAFIVSVCLTTRNMAFGIRSINIYYNEPLFCRQESRFYFVFFVCKINNYRIAKKEVEFKETQ